mgnify:CR=1 FL=1
MKHIKLYENFIKEAVDTNNVTIDEYKEMFKKIKNSTNTKVSGSFSKNHGPIITVKKYDGDKEELIKQFNSFLKSDNIKLVSYDLKQTKTGKLLGWINYDLVLKMIKESKIN